MNFRITLLILLISLFAISCEEENDHPADIHDLLIGHWINHQVEDSIVSYHKSAVLKENQYGFTFNPDFSFIERKNSGWCGTPPISYGDFSGTWAVEDSIINISVKFWGGMADYKWKVISIDHATLRTLHLESEYHYDN